MKLDYFKLAVYYIYIHNKQHFKDFIYQLYPNIHNSCHHLVIHKHLLWVI